MNKSMKTAWIVASATFSLNALAQINGNPNNTGLAPFDNNTGKANNGIDPGTHSTAPINGAVKLGGTIQKDTPTPSLPRHYRHHRKTKTQIILDNVTMDNQIGVIQLAKDSGAVEATFKGNTLICTGINFDMDSFTTSLATSFPQVTFAQDSTRP